MSKVARVDFAFWIMKICATTLGETAGDLLSMTLDLGYAVSSVILIGLFLGSLAAQLRSRRFHPALYCAWRLSEGTLSVGFIESRRTETFYWVAILFSNTLGSIGTGHQRVADVSGGRCHATPPCTRPRRTGASIPARVCGPSRSKAPRQR